MRRLIALLASFAILAALLLILRPDGLLRRGAPDSPASDSEGELPPGAAEPAPPVLRGSDGASDAPAENHPAQPARHGTIGIRIRGRVVDDRRRNVASARVALLVDGKAHHTTWTGHDGVYRFEGIVPVRSRIAYAGRPRPGQCDCVIRAVAEDGRVGWRALPLSEHGAAEGDLELSAIRLEDAHGVEVHVRSDGTPVADALVRFGGGPADHRKPWDWSGSARTDASGVARLTGLSRGTAGLYVTADACGPGVAGLQVPHATGTPVEVTLPPRTFLDVVVRVEGTEEPVPDATVTLVVMTPKPDRGWLQLGPLEGIAKTDAAGTTRLPRFSPGCRGWVYVRAPGRPQRSRASHAEMRWDAAQVVVEVPGPNSLSWTVVAGDGPLPLDRTLVRICSGDGVYRSGGFLPPVSGMIEDGRLVVPHAVAQTEHRAYRLLATLPDGRCALAAVAQGEDQGGEVAFRGPRALTIRVVDHEGRPVAGIRPYLMNCTSSNLHDRYPVTDDRGACLLTPMLPEVVRVALHGVDQWIERQERDADLTDTDQILVFALPAPQRLRIDVTVDGEARLPGSFRLRVGRHRVDGRLLREDPIQGTLRATLACADPLEGAHVRMETESYGTASGVARLDPSTGEATVRLSLGSGGRILARVAPPSSGGFELFLERYHEEARVFSPTAPPLTPEAARDGVFVFEGLESGRFRLRERFTHQISDEVVIPDAGGEVELTFDLSSAGLIRGHVEVPEGYGTLWARVVVTGWTQRGSPLVPGLLPAPATADARIPSGAIPVDEDGSFVLHVPGDRTLRLEPWHPMLRSAGTVEVRTPRDDVRLTLLRGPSALLVFDREPTRVEQIALEKSVLLYSGDPRGAPAWRCPALASGSEILFGSFEPGTYTLWLDPERLAPIVLHDVRLGPGTTRIEGAKIHSGCRLLFDLHAAEGTVRPQVLLHASSLDGPHYTRSRHVVDPTSAALLSALGAGRFHVTVHAVGERGRKPVLVFDEEITVDGTTDAQVRVDLR